MVVAKRLGITDILRESQDALSTDKLAQMACISNVSLLEALMCYLASNNIFNVKAHEDNNYWSSSELSLALSSTWVMPDSFDRIIKSSLMNLETSLKNGCIADY